MYVEPWSISHRFLPSLVRLCVACSAWSATVLKLPFSFCDATMGNTLNKSIDVMGLLTTVGAVCGSIKATQSRQPEKAASVARLELVVYCSGNEW